MTHKEFLEKTMSVYINDPSKRAMEGSSCVYRTIDGLKCAIGQWIPDDKYSVEMEGCVCSNYKVKEALPAEVLALGMDFLYACQVLHDSNENWTYAGLSEVGQAACSRILRNYPCDHIWYQFQKRTEPDGLIIESFCCRCAVRRYEQYNRDPTVNQVHRYLLDPNEMSLAFSLGFLVANRSELHQHYE